MFDINAMLIKLRDGFQYHKDLRGKLSHACIQHHKISDTQASPDRLKGQIQKRHRRIDNSSASLQPINPRQFFPYISVNCFNFFTAEENFSSNT